jgi:hypothetical protein
MDHLELSIITARNPSGTYIPLSPLDIYLGHYFTGGVHFFTLVPDIERMKSALEVTLGSYPSFGACMVRESNTIGLQCGMTGTEFSVHRSTANCPDFWSSESLITDDLLASIKSAAYAFNSGEPVSRFALVIFKDRGCALVIQHIHSQADGSTVINFLEAWSRAYRRQPIKTDTDYSRARILQLATENGVQPSAKLNITNGNIAIEEISSSRNGGAIRIDVAEAALSSLLQRSRMNSRIRVSSSDILHALVWKCFGLVQDSEPEQNHRLYTLFDLRGLEALGIPKDYQGSAILGRFAAANYGDIRELDLTTLAALFRRQVKPFTEEEARHDISYLTKQYMNGELNEQGNYANFIIAAWRDCRDKRGLVVNDLRFLAKTDIIFEDRSARMETLVSDEVNMVSIYQNDDGTITFHYVGERPTLQKFANQLKLLLQENSAGCNESRHS